MKEVIAKEHLEDVSTIRSELSKMIVQLEKLELEEQKKSSILKEVKLAKKQRKIKLGQTSRPTKDIQQFFDKRNMPIANLLLTTGKIEKNNEK